MNKRSYLVAAVTAELRAKVAIARFDKEFSNGNQNRQGNITPAGQNNNPTGNVPNQQTPVQQPQYG